MGEQFLVVAGCKAGSSCRGPAMRMRECVEQVCRVSGTGHVLSASPTVMGAVAF